jgi:hypothetical protein
MKPPFSDIWGLVRVSATEVRQRFAGSGLQFDPGRVQDIPQSSFALAHPLFDNYLLRAALWRFFRFFSFFIDQNVFAAPLL